MANLNLANAAPEDINYLRKLMAMGQLTNEDLNSGTLSYSDTMAEPPPQNMLARLQQDAAAAPPDALSRAVPGQGYQDLQSGQGVVQSTNPDGTKGPVIRLNFPQQQPTGTEGMADVTRPIEIAGRGKGYYSKDGTSAIINGQKVLLGYDRAKTEANQDRQMKLSKFDLDQRRGEQDIAESQAKIDNARNANMPRLGQGERFTASGEVEMIPGTAPYLKQMQNFKKDKDALNAVDTNADLVINKVNEIIDPTKEDAFNGQFGGYNAYLTRLLPGETQDLGVKIGSLKENLKMIGLGLMRQGGSIGQMTEKEWPIVQNQIEALDPRMSEKEARKAFENVISEVNRVREKARRLHDETWGGTQFGRAAAAEEAPASPGNLNSINTMGYSKEDIEHTAKLRGISPEEVIRQAKARGVK